MSLPAANAATLCSKCGEHPREQELERCAACSFDEEVEKIAKNIQRKETEDARLLARLLESLVAPAGFALSDSESGSLLLHGKEDKCAVGEISAREQTIQFFADVESEAERARAALAEAEEAEEGALRKARAAEAWLSEQNGWWGRLRNKKKTKEHQIELLELLKKAAAEAAKREAAKQEIEYLKKASEKLEAVVKALEPYGFRLKTRQTEKDL